MTAQAVIPARAKSARGSRLRTKRKPPHDSKKGSQSQAEVELIFARFRLRAQLRARWLQKLWTEEGASGGHLAVTHAEIATYLADRDSPSAETEWLRRDSQAVTWRKELRGVEDALSCLGHSRLVVLQQIFGLTAEESNLLQACIAVALDPALARVCAYLNDHAGRPFVTETLAARLFGYGRSSIWSANSPLFRWGLVCIRDTGASEPRALVCDPYISGWFLGRDELDEALAGFARYYPPRPPLASWPVAETARLLQHILTTKPSVRTRTIIHGLKGSGRKTLASTLSAELGLALLGIDSDGIEGPEWCSTFVRAQRHAYLNRCALAWGGEAMLRRAWPWVVTPFPIQFAIAEPDEDLLPVTGFFDHSLTLPPPTAADRETLWLEYLPSVKKWNPKVFRELVEQFRFRPGEIADAALGDVSDLPHVTITARESGRRELGDLVQRLECPFGWDDLILSESLREFLRDIEFEARHRLTFWEKTENRRLFPQGRGLLALFSGPPGTGKTMAAQVFAATLGYDLYRINLAALVSKWVGETSKHLERILVRAADMDVILLFDEADALFSKRVTEIRDAQDSYINTDRAYTLQAIESFEGVALLTTNKKGNIDPAFLRRLRFVLEFPKPDAAQQEQLWRNTIRDLTGVERLDAISPVLHFLSTNIQATGAQIKNAVLGGLFISQREGRELSVDYLLRGLERELSKEGRSISPREREMTLSHAK